MDILKDNAKKGVMIINGQTINLFDLAATPRQLEFSILAKGLTNIIRFNGFSNLSVAVHSLVLSHIVESISRKAIQEKMKDITETYECFGDYGVLLEMLNPNNEKGYALAVDYVVAMLAYDALIHDFSETLTGDVIRPFKLLVGQINEIADQVDLQIRKHYKAYTTMPNIVDVLDKQLATVEAYYLTRYHDVTLINVLDEFQTSSFNSSFFNNSFAKWIGDLATGGIPQECVVEPINEVLINRFLMSYAPVNYDRAYYTLPNSMDALKKLSQGELVLEMNNRFIELRNRLDSLYLALKAIYPENPCFEADSFSHQRNLEIK